MSLNTLCVQLSDSALIMELTGSASPESPDMNPIENIWHELKEYMYCEVKPRNKEQLVSRINQFWTTITVRKCFRYIGHLQKILSRVIEKNGDATGY